MPEKHIGKVVQVMGPVLDIRFADGELPELLNAIELQNNGKPLIVEVAQHIGDNVVRCIAMAATDGLVRGAEAVDTGEPIKVPVGDQCLGRVFNLLGEPVDNKPAPAPEAYWPIHRPAPSYEEQQSTTEILETGIKVVDLICPYAKGGKLGWTTEAQHTAVTWAEKDGLSLLCVVLDCSDKWGKYKDTIALFDYCFERYSMVSVKTDEIAAYDIPVGSLTNTAGMVHIAATGDLDVLVPKGTAVESIALKYNIPSRYKVGERIDPQVELWCGGELVGTFPMEYTVETYAPVEDVPKDDVTTAGSGSVVLTVLKWIGIVLGALIVILFVLRAYFMARRRRRAKQRRRAQRRRMN